MATISFRVTEEELEKINALVLSTNTDLTTLFLSGVGVRDKEFKISTRLLEERLKGFKRGAIITLADLLSFGEYSKLSFEDKVSAGRKLRELADRGKITLLVEKSNGRNRYRV